jgi:hypothetical protein
MEEKNFMARISAARMVASTFGVLAGVGGLTDGIGEALQGNVTPAGIMVGSWTHGPIATRMAGDPGMTIIPNLLATGIVNIVVSLVVVTWATALVQRKNGGTVLILLSIIMLLVGGGVGPPIIGVLAGIAGTRINVPLTWWRTHLPVNAQRFLAKSWPWFFGISAIDGVFLVVGSLILVYLFDVGDSNLFLNSFFLAALSVPFTILTGIAYDAQSKMEEDQ